MENTRIVTGYYIEAFNGIESWKHAASTDLNKVKETLEKEFSNQEEGSKYSIAKATIYIDYDNEYGMKLNDEEVMKEFENSAYFDGEFTEDLEEEN